MLRHYIIALALALTLSSFAQQTYHCKLYGTSAFGGTHNCGTIFCYDLDNDTLEKKADFNFSTTGCEPQNALFLAPDGLLYGTAEYGGAGTDSLHSSNNTPGTLFSFDPQTSALSKNYDFDYYFNHAGSLPSGALIDGGNGKYYGLTGSGGTFQNFGCVFEYDPNTNATGKKIDFSQSNGYSPYGSLVRASNNLLYGLTNTGGVNGYGTIFSYDIGTNTLAKLYDFDGTNGQMPFGDLVQASDGMLYGLTIAGGSHLGGVLFRFDPQTNTCATRYNFSVGSDIKPAGSLLQAGNGKLYGLTSGGGAYNYGTIFAYDISADSLTKLYDFVYALGKYPKGSLMQAHNGKLYGVTQLGAAYGGGAIFEYDIDSNKVTKKADLSTTTGYKPQHVRLIEICTVTTDPLVTNIPNIFTPNNDGVNDTWNLVANYPAEIKSVDVSIYDRWGVKIFSSNDLKKGWNGNASSGIQCPAGTYYYLLRFETTEGKSFSERGFITLCR